MRNRFDYVSKTIGEKALGPAGTTIAHAAIQPETQYADLRHEPDPARQDERDRLGLLGRLAASPCLIEVYSAAPDAEDFRACLAKHLAAWQQRARQARSNHRKQNEPPNSEQSRASFLWIIAAGTPANLIDKLKLEPAASWPPGIYLFGDDVLSVGIVAAAELPRERSNLLVRLMAGGRHVTPAVPEVAALPPTAFERIIAEPLLLQLQHVIKQSPNPSPDEKEFLMAMQKTWEDAKAEGKAEGTVEGLAQSVVTVLQLRGVAVPEPIRERILAQKDMALLSTWLGKAVVASSIAEVIDDMK
jgi:hypothetical protein